MSTANQCTGSVLKTHPNTDLQLTVGALLGSSSEKQLGHGHIVGHDGDIQGQETLTVWGVEVQLLQTVLRQKQLHQVQLLVLHCLKQRCITLELLWKDDAHLSY